MYDKMAFSFGQRLGIISSRNHYLSSDILEHEVTYIYEYKFIYVLQNEILRLNKDQDLPQDERRNCKMTFYQLYLCSFRKRERWMAKDILKMFSVQQF